MMLSNSAEELNRIADEAAAALSQLRDMKFKKKLTAIERASREFERAWSGSNIGYHATVYYVDFGPKPPAVQFSVEWGLEDNWPVHQPNPDWRMMDSQNVREEILSRASINDIETMQETVDSIRNKLPNFKDAISSVLSALPKNKLDGFVQKKSAEIQALDALDEDILAMGMLPKNYWSRDSLAMSQGLQVAPHQVLLAFYLASKGLESVIEKLENSARLVASHVMRLETSRPTSVTVGKSVFVGHGGSPVWRELKDFLERRLGLPVDEFNSVPVAGIATASRLQDMLDSASFAFLVMTAEDEGSDGKANARLNVIHEVGLFQGRLGFQKAIILLEEGCEEFSNIHGLGQIRFPKGSVSAKFEEMRAVLEREGLLDRK